VRGRGLSQASVLKITALEIDRFTSSTGTMRGLDMV
jgi:hypothetical protein